MSLTPKILVVDDEPRMCDSLKFLLSSQNYDVCTANSGREAIEHLSNKDFDVALLDIMMPDMDGHQLMDYINSNKPDTLIVVITGNATLESAVSALRKGAYDYLRKPFEYDELLRTVQNALDQKRLKVENQIISGMLALSEEKYRYLVLNSPDIIYVLDPQGYFTFINNTVELLLGYKMEELVGKKYSVIIHEEDLDKSKWSFDERRTGKRANQGIELRLKICNGGDQGNDCKIKHLFIELKSSGVYDKSPGEEDWQFLGTHGVIRDVSNRKQLEAELQKAKRLEALGNLAGGIAHDFNNLLMAIQGNTSLMLLDIDSSHPYYEKLKHIEESVINGSKLTKQLLGFARGGKYEVKPTNLNELIDRNAEIFGRAKKEIRIIKTFDENLWTVEVDQGQIEQVLLNLFMNAWQAMPGGGDIILDTVNVIIDQKDRKAFQLAAGKYVKISAKDTGVGMDENTQQRIFEPFFTTKAKGRGTGLGLASAYGIIRNHGGMIRVDSKKGAGADFTILLPASDKEVIKEKKSKEDILRGTETVLLVDDEEIIINVGREILKELGYRILEARSGKEAVEVFHAQKREIDIVILDMIMPEWSGKETYLKLKEIRPDVKVLLSSGYSLGGQASEIMEQGCNGFIQKPFSIKALSHKIREILET